MEGGINTALLPRASDQKEDIKGRISDESKKIWKIAFPGILARVSLFGTVIVTQSFIGHISETDLAAFALVQTLSVRFANGILLGMSSATETLCGQAYGAGQHHMMGIYLQRSWIVDLITTTIMLPIFLFGTSIFRLLGQEEDISVSAGYLSLLFIPFMYCFVFLLTIQMYLQAQQKNAIVAWISIFQFVIHVPLSWLFVTVLNMGVCGAMAAINISGWISVIISLVYVIGGWCPETWKGFTMGAFKDLWPVVKLSVSSGFMICLELWYTSVLVLLAGYMKNAVVAISAFSVCLNIHGWELMVNVGFLGAACVRVANELGRGDARAVKFSIKINAAISFIIGVLCFVLVLVFGSKIGYLFSNEKDVVDSVSSLSIPLAVSILLNGLYPVLSGVAVGAGLQGTVALISLLSYYVIGIPLGVVLGYVAHWELMLSLGFLGSACVRVANELGRGDARAVKFSIKMNAVISMMIGVVCFVLVLVFGDKIGYMFTNEKDVADSVSSLSIILAFAILLNGLYPVLSGVAVGAGLQGTVALISLLSYYVIGIPLGVVLGYVAHWQVKGIWIGMIIGMFIQTFILSYMIWKTNWDKEVEKSLGTSPSMVLEISSRFSRKL